MRRGHCLRLALASGVGSVLSVGAWTATGADALAVASLGLFAMATIFAVLLPASPNG